MPGGWSLANGLCRNAQWVRKNYGKALCWKPLLCYTNGRKHSLTSWLPDAPASVPDALGKLSSPHRRLPKRTAG